MKKLYIKDLLNSEVLTEWFIKLLSRPSAIKSLETALKQAKQREFTKSKEKLILERHVVIAKDSDVIWMDMSTKQIIDALGDQTLNPIRMGRELSNIKGIKKTYVRGISYYAIKKIIK